MYCWILYCLAVEWCSARISRPVSLPLIDPPGQKRKRVVRCCTMIWLSGMNKMRRRSSVRACGLLRLVRRCLSSWLIRALRVNALVVCDSAMGLQ